MFPNFNELKKRRWQSVILLFSLCAIFGYVLIYSGFQTPRAYKIDWNQLNEAVVKKYNIWDYLNSEKYIFSKEPDAKSDVKFHFSPNVKYHEAESKTPLSSELPSKSTTQKSDRPHILFILADDYGYNDIGYHGSEIKTPTLDRLAANGIKLENYYVQPTCTPSRTQFMSGRYQIHTGFQHGVIQVNDRRGLPTKFPTVGDAMREAGYATHIVGKWHLGHSRWEYTPTKRGFDTHYGYLGGNEHYYAKYSCGWATLNGSKERYCGHDFYNNTQPMLDEKTRTTYSTYMYTDKVIDLASQYKEGDKPLFIFLSYQSVHSPMQAPKEYTDAYKHIKDSVRQTYAGMVSAMDDSVDNITKAFKKLGLWDNTVMIFSTDNGGVPLYGGNNWPLRGAKGTQFEGGIRAVGFVNSPLLLNTGHINKELYHITDWFPTFLSLANKPDIAKSYNLDGFNIWQSLIEGEKSPRSEILINIDPVVGAPGHILFNASFDHRITAAIRKDNWKLVTGHNNQHKVTWTPPPHLVGKVNIPKEEPPSKSLWLFDITNDPNEMNDLSTKRTDVVHTLLERLSVYNKNAVKPWVADLDLSFHPKNHNGLLGPWLPDSPAH